MGTSSSQTYYQNSCHYALKQYPHIHTCNDAKVRAVLFLPKACVIAESVRIRSLLTVDLEGKPLRLFMSVLKIFTN